MTPQETQNYYQNNPNARWNVLILVCIGAFLTPLSLSAALVAIPMIASDLQANAVLVSWIPAAFLVGNLVALMPSGRLADQYGRKRLFFIGSIVFTLASLSAGLAPNIEWLLFFRFLQGVGAALYFGTSMAIVTSVFRNSGTGMAMGTVVSAVYLGLTLGPVIGGLLTEQFAWRAVFLAMVPLSTFSILLSLVKLKGEWRSSQTRTIDWTGAILFAVWAFLLFLSISSLPDPVAFIVLAIDAVVLLTFFRHTRRTASPLVNLAVINSNRVFSGSLLSAIFVYGGNYGLIFLLSIYLQINKGLSPVNAGYLLMLQAVFMAILAPISGRLIDHLPAHKIAASGSLITACGYIGLVFIDSSTQLLWIGFFLAITGVGMGMFSTPNNTAAMGSVSDDALGIASALVNLARLLGQTMGTAAITLLMTIYFGRSQILPSHQAELQSVYNWVMGLSLVFALMAAFYSYFRTGPKSQAL